jgi:hypothetical protein
MSEYAFKAYLEDATCGVEHQALYVLVKKMVPFTPTRFQALEERGSLFLFLTKCSTLLLYDVLVSLKDTRTRPLPKLNKCVESLREYLVLHNPADQCCGVPMCAY